MEESETRSAEFDNTYTKLNPELLESYWKNLFSQWYDGLPEISDLGDASWMVPRLYGILMLESQLQDCSMLKNS